MLINGTHIEKCCKDLLQKNVTFELKNKVLKRGKIVLFFQRNFHLVFLIDSEKKSKDKIEIPIPFKITRDDDKNVLQFDYRISTLSNHFSTAEPNLTVFTPKLAKNKFFDTILKINEQKLNSI